MKDEDITSEEFLKLFNSKPRDNCAGCGGADFRLTPTGMRTATIDEAIFMWCKNCGHHRLELMK